jgi:hypothetical protein
MADSTPCQCYLAADMKASHTASQKLQAVFLTQNVIGEHEHSASQPHQPSRLQIMMRKRRRDAQCRQLTVIERRPAGERRLEAFD